MEREGNEGVEFRRTAENAVQRWYMHSCDSCVAEEHKDALRDRSNVLLTDEHFLRRDAEATVQIHIILIFIWWRK